MISIIVAIAENNAIGYQNKLIYWLPNDLKRFKSLTSGNVIIMGRKTFESLPKGALPNRRNIVVSRTAKFDTFPGAECYNSLQEAILAAKKGFLPHMIESKDEKSLNMSDSNDNLTADSSHSSEIFIIGGASLYTQALPLADRLCLTQIFDTPSCADTFFPDWNKEEWIETLHEEFESDEKHSHRYAFINLERK